MNWYLIGAGLVVHLVFFYSIFDIYFTSPLVHGMTPLSTPLPPPAKRLVLFVADGLRADKLFELDEQHQTRAPFLRDIITNRGAWGVSHTRVPTETRPGHVALIAGFYEDVSAVAKGWEENPVEFDSVFNESRYTWSWGSPDILPAFAKGASGDHVFMEMYEHSAEDFAADSSKLDTWVFEHFKDFLEQSKHDAELTRKLSQEKIVFFLHLLGLDTNGHSHKPHSKEYLSNIVSMDAGVSRVVSLIEDYYSHDARTAYVLTSDHGMTNWGSHGSGDPTETLTPLVAWGAGVRHSTGEHQEFVYSDNFVQDWDLSSVRRVDVNQADIAPLMTSLIGVPFPINSVGELPIDYLNNSAVFKAESLYTNAQQILSSFEVKMKEKQDTTINLLFSPYKKLLPSTKNNYLRRIRKMIQENDYESAITESRQLIEVCLEGLQYYHNYDRLFLGISITIGFLGWMSYIGVLLIENHTNVSQSKSRLDRLQKTSFYRSSKGIRIVCTIIGVVIFMLLYVQSLSYTHYIYCLLPVILWNKVLQKSSVYYNAYINTIDCGYMYKLIATLVMGIVAIEIIMLSFSYRCLLSVGLAAMALWPCWIQRDSDRTRLYISWSAVCLLAAVFPFLPVVGRDSNYPLVFMGGASILCLAVITAKRLNILTTPSRSECTSLNGINKLVVYIQILVSLTSTLTVWWTSSSIANNQGLPLLCQIVSWGLLVLCLILPLFTTTTVSVRLLHIGWSYSSLYILLSTTHEGFFYLTLALLLCTWMLMEQHTTNSKTKIQQLDFVNNRLLDNLERPIALSDLRCSYFFIFFLYLAFFGVGNIASINSFEPGSVYCFLTVFNPFVMGGLMMLKILLPFMLVTCIFCAIHVMTNVPTQALMLITLLMSDVMALQFFYQVRDSGTWLEIGTSISHYVIVMCTICFLFVLLGVATVVTKFQIIPHKQKYHRK